MKSKSLLALTGVTVVAAAAAFLITEMRDSSVSGKDHGLLYPDLAQRVQDVARIEVTAPDASYAFVLDGERWGLEQKDGYPVDFERVRRTIVQVSDLAILDEKTDNPDLYEKLGLLEPEAPAPAEDAAPGEDARGTRLSLEASDGTPIASLVVGKSRPSRGGMASFYARRADEKQCWLVQGRLQLDGGGADWLDKVILKIEKDRVASIEVRHADGEVLRVMKASPDSNTFDVHDVPEGRELRYPTVANGMTSAVEWCNLDDVEPAEGFDWPEQADSTATFKTFDGLTLIAEVVDRDDKTYARFRASFSEEDRYQPKEGEELSGPLRSAEEARADAEEINDDVREWVYAIPRFNTDTYKKRMESLLGEPPAPEEPEAAEEPADGGAEGADQGPPPPGEEPPAEGGAGGGEPPAKEGEGGGEPPAEEGTGGGSGL